MAQCSKAKFCENKKLVEEKFQVLNTETVVVSLFVNLF